MPHSIPTISDALEQIKGTDKEIYIVHSFPAYEEWIYTNYDVAKEVYDDLINRKKSARLYKLLEIKAESSEYPGSVGETAERDKH